MLKSRKGSKKKNKYTIKNEDIFKQGSERNLFKKIVNSHKKKLEAAAVTKPGQMANNDKMSIEEINRNNRILKTFFQEQVRHEKLSIITKNLKGQGEAIDRMDTMHNRLNEVQVSPLKRKKDALDCK